MGIGYGPEHGLLGLRFGANTKLGPDDPFADQQHAEQVVIRKLQRAGYPVIAGIAIFGPVQPDTHSGLATSTLHPCGICRQFMLSTQEIDAQSCLIYTVAHAGEQDFNGERHWLSELVDLHNNHTAQT